MSVIDPRDFDLSGKGETNEQPQFQKMLDQIPDGAELKWPTPTFKVGLYHPLTLREKTRVTVASPLWHWDDYAKEYGDGAETSGIQLIWGGSAGEAVLSVINCGQCEVSGLSIHGMNAGVGLDIDQTQIRRRICTSNRFERMRVVGGVGNRDWTAIRVAASSKDNVEYMQFDRVHVSGNGDIDPTEELFGASMAAGSDVLTWTGTFGGPETLVGKRVRLPGVDAHILERLDDHSVRLDAVAPVALLDRRWLLDEAVGVGFLGGPSQNAMGHVLTHFHAMNCRVGIQLDGCSVHTLDYNADNNDENWRIGNVVPDSVTETRTNSENSRIHATIGCLAPFTSRDPSLRLNRVHPGTGFWRPQSGAYRVQIDGGAMGGTPGDGSTVWDFRDAAGVTVQSRGVLYDSEYTEESFGLTAMANNCAFDSDDEQPGGRVFGGRRVWGNANDYRLRVGQSRIDVDGDTAHMRVRGNDGRLGTITLPVAWDNGN